MSDIHNADDASRPSTEPPEPFRYPQDHVAAIVDTEEQLTRALDELIGGGFLESEVTVLAGPKEAERLASGTGRIGLLNQVLRIGDRIGLPLKELEVKERYERALREDGHVVLVLAPTEDRKRLASDILQRAGGYFIKFFGRFTIEVLAP